MSKMLETERFNIDGPVLIRPKRHADTRGFFSETWNRATWASAGLPDFDWVQDNEAASHQKGTLRGLHFQTPPFAQTKLIRVVKGAILDVAVDLRKSSPSFGQHISVGLDAANGEQLLVPKGFAHGYQTMTADTIVVYKCDMTYNREAESGLYWADVALGIRWPHADIAVTSEKDAALPAFSPSDSPF